MKTKETLRENDIVVINGLSYPFAGYHKDDRAKGYIKNYYPQSPQQFTLSEIDINDVVIDPTYHYDEEFGDDKKCLCDHAYYRHFDSYPTEGFPDGGEPVGCKYCECRHWTNDPLQMPMRNFMVRVITLGEGNAKEFDTGEVLQARTWEIAMRILYDRGENTEDTQLTVRELTAEEEEKLRSVNVSSDSDKTA